MTTVLVGMAVCVIAALLVLALVAVPKVREGEKLLTPDGEETLREASRRARSLSVQAVDRAGEVAADVREKAEGARSRRATDDEDADAWSAPTAVRPARQAQKRPTGAGARTTTLASPVAVSPVEEAAASPAARAPRVIDLRDPKTGPPPAATPGPEPEGTSTASRRSRRHREADLGWGEPRPGPRHSR